MGCVVSREELFLKSRPLGVTRINSLVQYLGRFLFFLRRHGALATFARIGSNFSACGNAVEWSCSAAIWAE